MLVQVQLQASIFQWEALVWLSFHLGNAAALLQSRTRNRDMGPQDAMNHIQASHTYGVQDRTGGLFTDYQSSYWG